MISHGPSIQLTPAQTCANTTQTRLKGLTDVLQSALEALGSDFPLSTLHVQTELVSRVHDRVSGVCGLHPAGREVINFAFIYMEL